MECQGDKTPDCDLNHCNITKISRSCFMLEQPLVHIHRCQTVCQSCPTLCDPMDRSPQGSSVHGIFQVRILEWVAISSSRASSQPRDQTYVSCVSCIAGRFFTTEPPGKPMLIRLCSKSFKLVFSSMWTKNFQIYMLGLEKAEELGIQVANIHWIIEKAREFQKNIYFCYFWVVKIFFV